MVNSKTQIIPPSKKKKIKKKENLRVRTISSAEGFQISEIN